MRIPRRNTNEFGIDMTPMIDVVFQLLSFFVMSFKIVVQEGDFNIKMPLAAPREGLPDDNSLPPLKVRMTAAGAGDLANISLNENQFGTSAADSVAATATSSSSSWVVRSRNTSSRLIRT